MAGFDPDVQFVCTVPGAKLELGEYTVTDTSTSFVPSTFTNLIGGICVGELTDKCVGYAASLCEGPVIEFVLSDATATTINYVAWGW